MPDESPNPYTQPIDPSATQQAVPSDDLFGASSQQQPMQPYDDSWKINRVLFFLLLAVVTIPATLIFSIWLFIRALFS